MCYMHECTSFSNLSFPFTNNSKCLFLLLQSLERCQLKDVVAAKPEKLEASGLNSPLKNKSPCV